MVEAAERLSILGVPQAEDLISEQQERVIRAFADHVHSELLDEEPLRLGPVADPDVDVVEPEETEFSGRGTARHARPTNARRYSRSVRPGHDSAEAGGRRKRPT